MDYLALTRSLLYVIAVLWALGCVALSRNYVSVRRYLWMMLADAVAGLYLVLWPASTDVWKAIYAISTVGIAACALGVAAQGLRVLPVELRDKGLRLVIVSSFFAFMLLPVKSTAAFISLAAATLMFPIGIVTLGSSLILDVVHDNAFRTLGLLWSVQGLMLYLFAAGLGAQVGSWLPTLVVVIGMVRLGMDFKRPLPTGGFEPLWRKS